MVLGRLLGSLGDSWGRWGSLGGVWGLEVPGRSLGVPGVLGRPWGDRFTMRILTALSCVLFIQMH